LNEEEVAHIRGLVARAAAEFRSTEDPDFLDLAPVLSHELPVSLRRWLNEFRLHETGPGFCIVAGYLPDEERIGRTPAHWKEHEGRARTLPEEIYQVLLGSLLGDPFAWSTQQAGRVVHEVLPIKGHETEQLGSSSQTLLTWHTEDAFHPYKGDYLSLFCLRNPDRVATTVGSIDGIRLEREDLELLFQPHFTILPDESHLVKNSATTGAALSNAGLQAAYDRINQMNTAPEKMSVLFGDPQAPYVRIDPYFMPPMEPGHPAEAALAKLVREIESRLIDVVLTPGDCCILDNYRVVHGRRPFVARYDGRDRWLKRINITGDLRKSRAARGGARMRALC
jgi:Fe(II)/alpha-ketoglutarate-dependent arginine beta-hydroxylase